MDRPAEEGLSSRNIFRVKAFRFAVLKKKQTEIRVAGSCDSVRVSLCSVHTGSKTAPLEKDRQTDRRQRTHCGCVTLLLASLNTTEDKYAVVS